MGVFYGATSLTGGGPGALDAISGDILVDGDVCIAIDSGTCKTFVLDADSSLAEESPYVISPDLLPGTKRWIVCTDWWDDVSGTARILLDKTNNRISILDTANATKVVMGYLGALAKHDGTGNWTASDYGFWAAAGDHLKIDGDAKYKSGDWIVEDDGDYLIQNSASQTIIRLGTDSGEKGVFIYDTSGTQLAKYTSSEIYIGETNKYLQYTSAGGLVIKGSVTASTGTIGGFSVSANALYAGADDSRIQLDTLYGIHLGATAFAAAPFSVSLAGSVKATAGVIAGFTIDSTEGIYSGANATRVQMKSGAGFWAGATAIGDAPFSVTEAGVLNAESATLTGSITATSGTIGSFTIGNYLYTNNKLEYNDAVTGVHIGSDGIGFNDNLFTVSAAGYLTSKSGKIGGWDITTTSIHGVSAGLAEADYPFYAGETYANRAAAPFRIALSGALYATNAVISGALTAGAGSSINGQYLTPNTVGVDQLFVSALSGITADMGTINAGYITGATIQTAASGRRMRMNADGIACLSGETTATYGDATFKYGDITRKYGGAEGINVWINNPTLGIPYYEVNAGALSSIHLADRVADPAGVNKVGDIALVNTVPVLCVSPGSPGTWESIGLGTFSDTRTLILRPTFNAAYNKSTTKPTEVIRGSVIGYSFPVYNSDDEEMFFRDIVPGRWDGTSDAIFYIVGYLAGAETVGRKLKFQVSVQATDGATGVCGTTGVDADSGDILITTDHNAQYSWYTIPVTILAATLVGSREAIHWRIRRIASGATAITGEFVVTNWYCKYTVNKMYSG
jgi:hypothetical protein